MNMRINLGLKGQLSELVDTLTENGGYKHQDVIYDALALFDFAIQEIAAGKQFGSIEYGEDGQPTNVNSVLTPILQHLKKNPQWLQEYINGHSVQKNSKSLEPEVVVESTED